MATRAAVTANITSSSSKWPSHHITGSTLSLSLLQVWGKTGSKLYGKKSGSDYIDNQQRFKLFNKAALSAMTSLPFSPGTDTIVVCNDWHTALLPVLLKVGERADCMQSTRQEHTSCMAAITYPHTPSPLFLVSFHVFIIGGHIGLAACCRKCSGCGVCLLPGSSRKPLQQQALNHVHALRRTCTSPQASIWTQRQRFASTTLHSRCGSQFS